MLFLTDQAAVDEMSQSDLPKDCFAYDNEFPHHYYVNGEKVLVVRALYNSIKEAQARKDEVALAHFALHDEQVRAWAGDMERQKQGLPPLQGHEHYRKMSLPANWDEDEEKPSAPPSFTPPIPFTVQDLDIQKSFVEDMVIRTLYYKGNITGGQISSFLRVPFYGLLSVVMEQLRAQEMIDISGQVGLGDAGYQFTLTPKGQQRAGDALDKTGYNGPMPVSYNDLLASIRAQTIKSLVVTRQSIRKAFADLIISDQMFTQIGPAVNSASSIFFFGAAGNGKTSIAERITRLMGDSIYVPYACEADGQIIKLFDPINHTPVDDLEDMQAINYDARWVRIKRPVVVVGGELTMQSLDLIFNETAKTYEAPFQMKANGGIFLIDDFGRQLMRPMELLNRWIVPLEKRYDYLTLVTGKKLEVPFDQLIVFSTNLDPADLADEAFLRRIKYKINIIDPSEEQFRNIFKLVCKGKKVNYDDKGIDYLIKRWYKPFKRPFRSCQPRDLLDQMMAMAKYTMEPCSLTPDLIDSACSTYFINFKDGPPSELDRSRPTFA